MFSTGVSRKRRTVPTFPAGIQLFSSRRSVCFNVIVLEGVCPGE